LRQYAHHPLVKRRLLQNWINGRTVMRHADIPVLSLDKRRIFDRAPWQLWECPAVLVRALQLHFEPTLWDMDVSKLVVGSRRMR